MTQFLDGIGAIAEITKAFYDRYIALGFTEATALDLTKHMTAVSLQMAMLADNPENLE